MPQKTKCKNLEWILHTDHQPGISCVATRPLMAVAWRCTYASIHTQQQSEGKNRDTHKNLGSSSDGKFPRVLTKNRAVRVKANKKHKTIVICILERYVVTSRVDRLRGQGSCNLWHVWFEKWKKQRKRGWVFTSSKKIKGWCWTSHGKIHVGNKIAMLNLYKVRVVHIRGFITKSKSSTANATSSVSAMYASSGSPNADHKLTYVRNLCPA